MNENSMFRVCAEVECLPREWGCLVIEEKHETSKRRHETYFLGQQGREKHIDFIRDSWGLGLAPDICVADWGFGGKAPDNIIKLERVWAVVLEGL